MTPVGTPVRPGAPHTPTGNTCFKCGEAGHYANACPKRHPRHSCAEPADVADEERELDLTEQQGTTESGPWQGEPREYRDRSGESTSGAWYVLCQLHPRICLI
jgi:hypothetical protein